MYYYNLYTSLLVLPPFTDLWICLSKQRRKNKSSMFIRIFSMHFATTVIALLHIRLINCIIFLHVDFLLVCSLEFTTKPCLTLVHTKYSVYVVDVYTFTQTGIACRYHKTRVAVTIKAFLSVNTDLFAIVCANAALINICGVETL